MEPAVRVGGVLSKRPLVDDARVACVVEEAGSDPRLGDQPSTDVDTSDLWKQASEEGTR